MNKLFENTPGVVWAAIIVGLMLFAEWLKEYFGGLEWVPPLTGFILAVLVPVLKVLVQGEQPAGRTLAEKRSWLDRLLW